MKNVIVSTRIDEDLSKQLNKLSELLDRDVSWIARKAISEYLKANSWQIDKEPPK